MRWIREWRFRDKAERDLTDEIRAHIEIEKSRRMAGGESAEEAGRAARLAFGNLAATREDVRETWGWSRLERMTQDAGFGVRMLRKTPVWTAVVCMTLALGIGMSTAIFSVVYAVLLQPLPYPESDRIMALSPTTAKSGNERFRVSPALWRYWREHLTLVEDLALTRPVANFNLTGEGAPERLLGARTTFSVPLALRVRPILGRLFTEEEQLADARVALLSHPLWIRRFGGDASIIGKKIQLNGESFEVIGVMPVEYRYPDASFELWTPLYLPPPAFDHGVDHSYLGIARLKTDASVLQAQAELDTIMQRVADEFPSSYAAGGERTGGLIEPLAQLQAWTIRPTLLILTAAVGCLLLIGCMNLAVLLIARASGRAREMVVRAALGASAQRLRRQLLAEAVPLGLAGAGGGVLLAWWMLRALAPMLPANMPRVESLGLNGAVAAFAIAASLTVVIAASLLPSRLASRMELTGLMQRNSRGVAGGGVRDTLVAGQVAMALLLLFGGILLARSFAALLRVTPGFSSQGVLTMHLAVSRSKYPGDPEVSRYYSRLIELVKTVPGVLEAGIVNRLPLSGLGQTGGVEFEGRDKQTMVDWRSATPGYFVAMGIPLQRGRGFSETDGPRGPLVGLIDEDMARRAFGDENPIGKRFRRMGPPGQPNREPWAEIIGVAGHVLGDSLEKDPRPQVYWPASQRTQDRGALVVRTTGNPEAIAPAVVERIHRENPDQPVYDIRPMEDWVDRSMQSRTLTTSLVSLFGGASVLLACLGLYGVVSYAAGLRVREFGVRLALGATTGHVRRLVLRYAGKLALAGVTLGLLLCWPAGKALRGMLFGVTNLDMAAWIVAPGLLMAVALAAGLGPARRAANTDPAQTLRAE
ncbi:MAG: ADOP family duplicated permease [Bryobacteraceae bacterium]